MGGGRRGSILNTPWGRGGRGGSHSEETSGVFFWAGAEDKTGGLGPIGGGARARVRGTRDVGMGVWMEGLETREGLLLSGTASPDADRGTLALRDDDMALCF